MDTWVISTFWLLWIMLLWTLVYKYLFASLLSISLGVEFLYHMVILCLTFWETTKLFPTVAANIFTFPPAMYKSSNFLFKKLFKLKKPKSSRISPTPTPHLLKPLFASCNHQSGLCICKLGDCCCCYCFQIPHMREIIQYLSFSVWLISLSIMPSRSIHVVANCKISFSLMTE